MSTGLEGPDLLRHASEEATKGTLVPGVDVFVGYLDILGFRNLVHLDSSGLYEKYKAATRMASYIAAYRFVGSSITTPHYVGGFTKINRMVTFSDSIFVSTLDKSEEAGQQISHVLNMLFRHYIREGLPIRGSLSLGKVWWDPEANIFLGPGIVSAYELAESLDGIGVAVDPRIESQVPSFGPSQFYLKSGGPILLKVPIQIHHDGWTWDNGSGCSTRFDALRSAARASGNLAVLAKYDRSVGVVSDMVQNRGLEGNPFDEWRFEPDPPDLEQDLTDEEEQKLYELMSKDESEDPREVPE